VKNVGGKQWAGRLDSGFPTTPNRHRPPPTAHRLLPPAYRSLPTTHRLLSPQ